jgi:hypothetical protein
VILTSTLMCAFSAKGADLILAWSGAPGRDKGMYGAEGAIHISPILTSNRIDCDHL